VYWRKVPWIIQRLVPHVIWRIPNSENKIYLTFDDGPCPNVTNKILEILHEKEVKASFFCLGKNVENHPNIFEALKENGHFVLVILFYKTFLKQKNSMTMTFFAHHMAK